MEVYTHLQSFKDSSGKIQKCVLRNDSTGKIGNYDRDIIMHNMKANVWKVKGLMIDDAQRLRTTNKDELIEEYKKACRTLGIAPVDIMVTNKDEYVVTDVPYNRVTKIPDFADGIVLQKKFIKGQVNNATQANGNSSTNTKSSLDMLDLRVEALFKYLKLNIDKLVVGSDENKAEVENLQQTLDSMQQTLLQSVGQLGSDIDGLQNDLGQSSSDIEQKMNDISDILDNISQAQSNLNISSELSNFRTEVLDGINQVVTLQNAVKPVLDDISNRYNNYIASGGFNQSRIRDFDKLPKFLRTSESDYALQSNTFYNNFVSQIRPETMLIPFDKLDSLRDDIDFLYNTYDIFDEFFDGLKQEELDYINEFTSGNSSLNNFVDGTGMFIKGVKGASNICKSLHNTIQDRLNYNKKLNTFYNIYTNSNLVLDQFYCDKDVDVLKFLFEYKVLKKSSNGSTSTSSFGKPNKVKVVHYRLVFRTIYQIRQEHNITLANEEVIKRLAIAYILSEKILRNEIPVINIIGYYADDVNLRSGGSGGLDIKTIYKYREFHHSIMYVLMHSILVLLGFTPESSYTYFISIMKKLEPRHIIDLDYQDIQNLTFDYTKYENQLKGLG